MRTLSRGIVWLAVSTLAVVAVVSLVAAFCDYRRKVPLLIEAPDCWYEDVLTVLVIDIPDSAAARVRRRLRSLEDLSAQYSDLRAFPGELTEKYDLSEIRMHRGHGAGRVKLGAKIIWMNDKECEYVAMVEVTTSTTVFLGDSQCLCMGDDNRIVRPFRPNEYTTESAIVKTEP